MKKWSHLLVIILIIGFFAMPTLSYACGTKTEKSCCTKENTSKTEKKDCCKSMQSKGKGTSCGGKCGHSNCTSTSSLSFSLLSYFEIDFTTTIFDFISEKQKFYSSKTAISSGFYSVWLIPKIS